MPGKKPKGHWKKIAFLILLVLCIIIIFFSRLFFQNEQRLAGQLPSTLSGQDLGHGVHYIKLQDINPYIKEAAVSSQDKRFYHNLGVDAVGTARALFATVSSGQRQGASTITEQLAKNAYFKDRDTLQTDIQTKILAPFITFKYSKNDILEMYLNGIYFGRNAYGIYNAGKVYFNTTPDKVTLAQAAYLMGLINAPSYFAVHPNKAVLQSKLVLGEMKRDKYISAAQETAAEKELQNF